MARKLSRPRNLIDAVDRRVAEKTDQSQEGKIVFVGPLIARVKVKGSTTPIPCGYDGQDGVSVGKRCKVEWSQDARKYVITSVYASRSVINPQDRNRSSFELAPPSSIAVSSLLSGAIMLSWRVPPQQHLTFEIQKNTSAIESGATLVTKTSSGQFIVESNDPLYLRIRSVDENFKTSSWSTWILGTPGIAPIRDRIGQILVGLTGEILIGLDGSILVGLP